MAHHEEKPADNQMQGQKPSAAKRTMNPPQGGRGQSPGAGNTGVGDQQEDPKRRLGGFAGKGEHPRTGNPGHQ